MSHLDEDPSHAAAPLVSPDPQPPSIDDGKRIQRCLADADALKQDGNAAFRAGQVADALAAYRSALGRLPKRALPAAPRSAPDKPRSTRAQGEESDEDEFFDAAEEPDAKDGEEVEGGRPVPYAEECAKARAVLNGNVAACYAKLGEHKEVVTACGEALLDDPDYIKALQRRALANENLNTWASLASAKEDYEKLLTLHPPSSAQVRDARRALQRVAPRAEAAQKAEMAEMVDKLKGFGNSILGRFGMSTDNFKFEPNGQGGYSVNFSQQ